MPALASGFDCERGRLLEREFPLDDWRRREADLPFEVPYRTGEDELWALVYVLIEHQSGEDPVMPLRLLYFVVLYWERQWRGEQAAAPKSPLRLSPVLPLVLHTGPGPWQNNRTLHDLLGEPAVFHGFVPQWAPLFWELSAHDADELLSSGDAWQETLAVLRVQGEDAAAFERIYVEAMRRLAPLAAQDHVRWYDLMRIILSWGMWRRPETETETLLAAARAAQTDANRQKEVTSMGQTIWEAAHAKGELRALRRTLRQLVADRFGSVPEAVLQRIESSTDVDRLTAAAVQVSHVATPEDLQF